MSEGVNQIMRRQQAYRVLYIFFLVAIVATFHLLNQGLVNKFNLKLDLTENALYKFSDTTYEVIDSLISPVDITVFNSESEYVIILKEILKHYDNTSTKIRLHFVDPYENPVLIDQYLSKGIHIQINDIIIEGANGFQLFPVDDMYFFNSGKTQVVGINAEQKITTALLVVNTENSYTAAFTDGHNERPSEALFKLFSQNSFDILRGTLSRILSSEPNLIILASPERDFRQEEIDLLEEYLNRGGSLMVFREPSLKTLENLDQFLSRWGIIPGERLVFETEAYTSNNPLNIVPMYSPHTINRYFQNTRIFITMPSCRNLRINSEAGSAYDISPVLNSTPDSYGKIGYHFNNSIKDDQDSLGPFYLAISSEKAIYEGDQSGYARIFVAGSRNIYGDDLLLYASYGNADFLVQVINWLSERDLFLSIPSKTIQAPPLNIKRSQALLLGGLVSILIPSLILFYGIAIFIRRRKL